MTQWFTEAFRSEFEKQAAQLGRFNLAVFGKTGVGKSTLINAIFGEPVAVRARIYTVGGLSAHADQAALLDWLRGFQQAPGRTFIVHGEATAEDARALVEEGIDILPLPVLPGERN